MPDTEGLKPVRLFIGLWPDTEVRRRLYEAGQQMHRVVGGRLTRPETIHLTLVFIGNLERERLPSLVSTLDEIRGARFEVGFDQLRCWNHNRIGFLSPSKPPSALFNLVDDLEVLLDRLAVQFDRRAYKPHVTLIRKADCKKNIPDQVRDAFSPSKGVSEPILWPAQEFVLVESVLSSAGPDYRIVKRYALS